MPAIKLHFEGQDSEAATAELETLLTAQFGHAPRRVSSPPPSDGDRRGASLALIALVLSLPGATENTLKLAERIRLRERVQALINYAKQLKDRGTIVRLDAGGPLS